VCEGVGCQLNEVVVDGVPFLEKGEGILIALDLIVVLIVIIGREVNDGVDSVGISWVKNPSRDCV